MVGVGIRDLLQNALKSMSHLHGQIGGYGQGRIVDWRVTVVYDGSGLAISLRDHATWRELQVRVCRDGRERENCPVPLFDHV